MSKKTAYSCQSCGAITFKWSGKCPECNEWNTLIEEFAEGGSVSHFSHLGKDTASKDKVSNNNLNLVNLLGDAQNFPRLPTAIGELDRSLGGGLVQGSVVLIGGDPGIGKSTLLLQTANSLAKNNNCLIYISGEESIDQVRLRAKRLGVEANNIKLAANTNVAEIIQGIKSYIIQQQQPIVVIIDSIQTMFVEGFSSAPGTVSQVRAAAGELTIFAKQNNVTLLIVSHVTKDGQIAGPKVLEHMVDTVLYFEGEKDMHFRILRAVKNRFGAANEIGVFAMDDIGLSEVNNPSELFLNSYQHQTSGTSVFAGIEGTRPILAEIQALVAPSFLPTPRRAVVGWDLNRLAMIVAVLNTRYGLNLCDKEIYLNVVGGLKISETSADLAVACALISAAKDLVLPDSTIAIGEIGLTGEVRMIGNLDTRLKEAEKLGFTTCLLPKANEKNKNFNILKESRKNLKLITISHIRDLAKILKKHD